MSTQTQICNLALRLLGAERITALTDKGESARVLNDVYELIRDEVLAAHPWNFACKRVALALLAETPAYGYTYVFALPVGCLRVLETEDNTEYQVEGGKLLTNEATVSIKYIYQVTTSTSFTPGFISAFATRLASEIALPITNNPQLPNVMYQQYLDKLRLAKSIDGQEGTIVIKEDTSWIDDRE